VILLRVFGVQRCRELQESKWNDHADHVIDSASNLRRYFLFWDATRKYRDLIPRIKRQENGQWASKFSTVDPLLIRKQESPHEHQQNLLLSRIITNVV
jgi:hypothetical protein